MLIPEREKGVKSFRIPKLLMRSLAFIFSLFFVLMLILAYDYWQILKQVYENKHLSLENRQLKEQIDLFQVKINSLSQDYEKLHIFHKKLEIVTGMDEEALSTPMMMNRGVKPPEKNQPSSGLKYPDTTQLELDPFKKLRNFEGKTELKRFVELHEEKMAQAFGLESGYSYTKQWSRLTKKSFSLASDFALIDYQLLVLGDISKKMDVEVNRLDQKLMDKHSLLRSTPTIPPAVGWVTSFYGPRVNPVSGKLKMHEGVDLGGRIGQEVVAPADGVIVYSGRKPGFGLFVQIDHGYGIETVYGHNSALIAKKGDTVKRGQLISKIGNTGISTGPHLHYEIWVNGTPVDPLYFMLN